MKKKARIRESLRAFRQEGRAGAQQISDILELSHYRHGDMSSLDFTIHGRRCRPDSGGNTL